MEDGSRGLCLFGGGFGVLVGGVGRGGVGGMGLVGIGGGWRGWVPLTAGRLSHLWGII